ncbi:amidase [Nesterenkonia populi]
MFEELTITRYHQMLRAGETTAEALTEWYLDRIAALSQSGPQLNAVTTVAEDALASARKLDADYAAQGHFTGELHGVPVLVKDQAETAGLRTTFGSRLFENYIPEADATIVTRLREAGAIILGKTTMCDFAAGWFSSSSMTEHTKTPYDLSRDSGGSSAGSGSAVGANLCLIAVGEDTGGSIRIPASFNNVVGLRPTTGLVPRTGFSPLVHFQDTPGPIARTVEDAARLLDVLAGFDPADEYTSVSAGTETGRYAESLAEAEPLDEARLGVLASAFGPEDPDSSPVNQVIRTAVDTIRGAGAAITPGIEIENLYGWIEETSVYTEISKHDLTRFLAARGHRGINSFEDVYNSGVFHRENDLFHDITGAADVPEENFAYLNGRMKQDALRRHALTLMGRHKVDFLIYPSVQVPSPTHEELDAGKWTALTFPTNTVIGSQTSLPAISVPAGFTETGLPVGLEILGTPLGETKLLQLASQITALLQARRTPQPETAS